jgi:hypothetical protein
MEPGDIAATIGVALIGRLAHGENAGAYAVQTADGTSAVLKLFNGDGLVGPGTPTDLTGVLRERGYPAPAIHVSGVLDGVRFEIQELMPGEQLGQATSEMVGPLRELVDLQRDVAPTGHAAWLDKMIASVIDGCVGYCERAAVLAYSDEARAMIARLDRIAVAANGTAANDGDIVHYDFSPHNVLTVGNRISGVVDWDGATRGDAAFDLVTMAAFTYDYSVRDELLAAAASLTTAHALGLYAAHMVLRQIDWALRHHTDFEVAWFIDTGSALLDAVGAE